MWDHARNLLNVATLTERYLSVRFPYSRQYPNLPNTLYGGPIHPVLPNTPTRRLVATSSGPCHGMLEGGYNLGELCLAHPKSSQCTPPCCWLLKKLPLQNLILGPATPCYEVLRWRQRNRNEDELEVSHQTVTASALTIPRRARQWLCDGLAVHDRFVESPPFCSHGQECKGCFTQGARYDSVFFGGIGGGPWNSQWNMVVTVELRKHWLRG